MRPMISSQIAATAKWTLLWLIVLIFAAIVLGALLGWVAFEVIANLAFGWVRYITRVSSRVAVSRTGLATVTICSPLLLAGVHRFLTWLRRETTAGPRIWKLRWTCAILGIVVLMFAAGIATVGITHQTAWLLTAKKPLVLEHPVVYDGERGFENNLKQIALAVNNYASANNGLPGDRPSEGRAWQSWQTVIGGFMPFYVGDIDFERSWDDPRNSPKFRGFIDQYLNPKATVLRDDRGFAVSHIAGNVHVFGRGRSLKFEEVGNLYQTMMAGEVASGFKCWGDPTNLRDPSRRFDGSPEAFGSPSGGGATVVMMDGSVKFISDRADPRVLRALCGRR